MSSIPGGFQREFNFPLRAPIDFIFIQFVGLTKWVLDSKGYVYRTNLRPSKLTIRACRFFKIDTVGSVSLKEKRKAKGALLNCNGVLLGSPFSLCSIAEKE